MRTGAFDISIDFQTSFVLAEVCNGLARVMRYLHVRNVRGDRNDWLKLTVVIGDRRTKNKSVNKLAVGDEARAEALGLGICSAFTVPVDLRPGRYTGRLIIIDSWEQREREISFSIEILDACMIPTDFARSGLLAAYLREDDMLRQFASDRLPASDAASELRRIYSALLERQLAYQPPVSTHIPDCQRISEVSHTLAHGGSCADLSLLLASLLWCRGLSPAILLFPGHMAAGVFTDDRQLDFDTLDVVPEILRLMDSESLILLEVTALCGYRQQDFDQARLQIRQRLRDGETSCVLVNTKRLLRQGGITPVSELPKEAAMLCPHCKYNGLTQEDFAQGVCPACGEPLPVSCAGEVLPQEVPQVVVANSGVFQYGIQDNKAVVQRLLQAEAQTVRVAPLWRGRILYGIADRALEGSGVTRVLLPETIVHIGDFAFSNCSRLTRIALPEELAYLGAGAFCGSGLKSTRLPGSLKRISRMAFSFCQSLEEVVLEDGIERIGERAFAGCPLLKTVHIPASVRRIERDAFDRGCELLLDSGLTEID